MSRTMGDTLATIAAKVDNNVASNDSRKRQEMRLIKRGTVHSLGINERFSFI